jgi:hypothetical protein
MTEAQMSMLLSAISSALKGNERERAIDLANAGMTVLKGAEFERVRAWREIENLAGWSDGFSNE